MEKLISQQTYENMEMRLKQVEAILRQLAVIDKENSAEKLHDAIQQTLQIIGEYTSAGRVFIFDRLEEEQVIYTNSYEWCAPGVASQIGLLQHMEAPDMPYWHEKFEHGESIIIPDLEKVRAEMPLEYDILKVQDIYAEIAVPIFYKERLTGFIGLDNPSMDDQILLLQLLNLVGTHLGSNRENIRMVSLLKQKQRRLEQSLREQEREKSILNVLCYDYTSVYMVDLQADWAEIMKLEKNSNASDIVNREKKVICYSKLVKSYYDHYVIKEECPEFLERLRADRLLEELQHTNRIIYRYHTFPNAEGKEFFELQVTKIENAGEERMIIMGFRHIDHIMKEERKHQNSLEIALEQARLNNEIISAISKIYFAIYRIDLNTDFYEEVSSDSEVHSLTGTYGKASARMKEICDRFVTPEYSERVMEFFDLSTLKERMKEEETIAIEYLAKDGNWHLARFIVKKRDAYGNVENVLYVTRLISDQKRREQYWIMMAEAANKANEAKSEFLSRMSHDIRTPLNVITGLVDVARTHVGEQKKVQECLDKISVTGRNLENLVNDVLDLKQIESGKLEIRPKEMQITDLFETVQKMLDQDIYKRRLEFSCTKHDIQYPYLYADQLRIEQICTNLLSNAVKYTPDGGKVSFDLYEKPASLPEKVQLICVISDTGIGMTPEFMKEMYSEFSRAVDTRVNKVRGSGLGLAIVKQIVDLIQGTIEVDSRPNEGTRFCVTIEVPWIEKEEPEETAEKENVHLEGLHLLIAEDNDLSYEVEEELLTMRGIQCMRAENGQVCVEKFLESQPGTIDAILMDMQMPVMDGPTAAKEIRGLNHPMAKEIPIIAVTANAYQEDIEKCLAAGMNEHLAKPVDYKKLEELLKKYTKKKEYTC